MRLLDTKYKPCLYIKYASICYDRGHEIELETEPKSESVPASKVAVLTNKGRGITCEQLIRFQGISYQSIISRNKFHFLGHTLLSDVKAKEECLY
ncbi:hypothetical protein EB796_007350 [Bugula neritina]|uniref:Uncharacterized protein n=1 Tax=Bugula neritina TaxID=10212 RepID=A0A7J7K819_BUGNE|nr:hypothetical protein EB796_007350 [Bugula neritina]